MGQQPFRFGSYNIQKASQFIAITKKGIFSIAEDGSQAFLSDQWQPGQDDSVSVKVIPSPDGRWFVVFNENLLGLFSESNQLPLARLCESPGWKMGRACQYVSPMLEYDQRKEGQDGYSSR